MLNYIYYGGTDMNYLVINEPVEHYKATASLKYDYTAHLNDTIRLENVTLKKKDKPVYTIFDELDEY